MKTKLIIAAVIVMTVFGCTTTGNKLADDAFKRGLALENSIIQDLELLAIQYSVDKNAAAARTAAANTDAEAAEIAVKQMATDFDKISWLTRTQHTRAREMLRIPQRYIWKQRGWLSILYDDYKKAKEQLEEIAGEPESEDTDES